ncbi:hypothetical protein ACXZ7E_09440 [Paenibacillus lautus]
MINTTFDNTSHFSTLKMVTFTYAYFGELGKEGNGFRVFVKFPPIQSNNSPYLFIVNSIGGINPRSKADEIYNAIINITMQFGINLSNVKVVLDLLGFTGIGKDHLFDWVFKEINGQITEEIVTKRIFTDDDKIFLEEYYENYLSIFTKSSLNNKQKAEIAAYALAEKCYDSYTIENITKNFKYVLSKAVQNKEGIKSAFIKRN